MLKVGDTVRWMCPLDHDYTYGIIVSLTKSVALVKGIGIYKNVTAEVHLRYIKKVVLGGIKGNGSSKRNN